MAQKKGAGNKPQEYDEKNGQYTGEGSGSAGNGDGSSGNGGDGTSDGFGGTRKITPAEEANLKNRGIHTDEPKKSGTPEERRLIELGIEEDKRLSPVESKEYYDGMLKAKESNPPEGRWRVDIHDESDYAGDKLFMSEGGSCVAVEPSGNIISVCRHQDDKTVRGKDLIAHAVKNGGDRLDAFGENLYRFYTRQGFEPVSWTPFDERYAPEGWDKNRDEPEPVIFYKYTGKVTNETFDEFKSRVNPSADYDAAMKIRDEDIKR